MLLRQAVERDVIADYPDQEAHTKGEKLPLRLELKPDERARFFGAFTNEAAFLRYVDENRQLGLVKSSQHFTLSRRFGGGMRGDSDAARTYFARFRELREFFVIATETGLRMWSDLRNLRWSAIDAAGFVRVVMHKTQREAENLDLVRLPRGASDLPARDPPWRASAPFRPVSRRLPFMRCATASEQLDTAAGTRFI